MRNNLNGGAQIIAMALFVYHALINFAGGDAIRFVARNAGKTLIVT